MKMETKNNLEIEGVMESMHTQVKKVTIILTNVSDEDYAKLLSSAHVKITILDDSVTK